MLDTNNIVRCILLIYSVMAFNGCNRTQSDYERALRTDSIEAWQTFINVHPNSKYDAQVKGRLATLQKEAEELRLRRDREAARQEKQEWRACAEYNDVALKRLKNYQAGITSKQVFASHGWSCLLAHRGMIGILSYTGSGGVTSIHLGIALPPGVASNSLLTPIADMDRFVAMSLGSKFFSFTWNGSKLSTEPIPVCTVKLANGVVDSIAWAHPPDMLRDTLVNNYKPK